MKITPLWNINYSFAAILFFRTFQLTFFSSIMYQGGPGKLNRFTFLINKYGKWVITVSVYFPFIWIMPPAFKHMANYPAGQIWIKIEILYCFVEIIYFEMILRLV